MEDWQSGKTVLECNLYMLHQAVATDITLVVGSNFREIPAHKYVLVSRSVVFYTMFYGSLAETGDKVIIPDIEEDVMRAFLGYLYTDNVEMGPSTVMGLLYAGKKYCVPALVDKCRSYLETKLDPHNICAILEQSHLFEELRDKCLEELFNNAAEIIHGRNEDIANLCSECLKTILKSEKLVVKEEDIFEACLLWSAEQCKRRGSSITDSNLREQLGDALFLIRFPIMDAKYFTAHVSTRDILTPEEKVVVFQKFSSSPRNDFTLRHEGTQFIALHRVSRDVHRTARFEQIVGGIFDFWQNDNHVNAISFSVSKKINLIGVSVFAPFKDGLLRGRVRLYDSTNWLLAKRENLEIVNTKNNQIKDVKFKYPVKLKLDTWYTVTQEMLGAHSFFGKNGQRSVTDKGVTFTFRRSPMEGNKTDVASGHIYAFLYTMSL